jgi:hypothetical protein
MFLNDITYSTSLCDDGVLINFNTLSSTGTGIAANISPADTYLIEFSEELTIPSGNTISISPSGYTLTNVNSFTPQCFVKIRSEYTDGSQTVLKLVVKDSNYNILSSQYKRVICSSQSAKPCIVPVTQVSQPQYIVLSNRNNWEYIYNGYIIAKFALTNITDNLKIQLPRKDATYLPSRGQNDQIKIIIAQSRLLEYKLTADGIKALLGGNTAYTVKNKNVIFVFDSLGRTIQQVQDIQIASVPVGSSSTPQPVAIKSLGSVEFNSSRPAPIPSVSIVRWNNGGIDLDLGELIVNPDVYQINDEIIITRDSDKITGAINFPLLLLTS